MLQRVMVVAVLLTMSAVLSNWSIQVSIAGETIGAAQTQPLDGLEAKKTFDAHDTGVRYHFNDTDMDFNFGTFVLGGTVNHGVEIGEAFNTAAKIKDGDAASWQEQWFRLAQLVEARGEKSLTDGHKVSARDQFQRASNYYRISLLAILADDPRLKERALKSRSLMKKAGELFNPPMEYIEIPFEGTILPGYFRKASSATSATKTLIMIGGGETFAEDLIFYIAPQAHDRGYNFMTIDLPGQGLLPLEGKFFRPDMNVPLKAVVDYALSRKDVDSNKLAMFGYSGGGGFVPQAAMHDPRIKAIAMNSGVVDAYPLFSTMPVVLATKKERANWSTFHTNIARAVCWRWGTSLDIPMGLAKANRGFTFDPEKIAVPALLMVGEGEYKSAEVVRQQKVIMDGLPNPLKKMVITPTAEGATNHCVMENRSLVGQVLFDWLDDVFQ
ncbi:MAG: alpha/beta hydrolase family protein [Desulfobulbus sp.]